MIKRALALTTATAALLLLMAAGNAVAAPDPEGAGQETCATLFQIPLLMVQPPTDLELRLCQHSEDQDSGGAWLFR